MRETQEVLTPLFLEGVGKVAIEKTLVLLLDTYEVTGTFLDEWVRSLLEERFGALGRSVLGLAVADRFDDAYKICSPLKSHKIIEAIIELYCV